MVDGVESGRKIKEAKTRQLRRVYRDGTADGLSSVGRCGWIRSSLGGLDCLDLVGVVWSVTEKPDLHVTGGLDY